MKEKKKIRYNNIFNFDIYERRKAIKKAIKRREQQKQGKAVVMNVPERNEKNKEKYLRLVKEANVTIDECNAELKIIIAEINRLKKEKEALQSAIKYIEESLNKGN